MYMSDHVKPQGYKQAAIKCSKVLQHTLDKLISVLTPTLSESLFEDWVSFRNSWNSAICNTLVSILVPEWTFIETRCFITNFAHKKYISFTVKSQFPISLRLYIATFEFNLGMWLHIALHIRGRAAMAYTLTRQSHTSCKVRWAVATPTETLIWAMPLLFLF